MSSERSRRGRLRALLGGGALCGLSVLCGGFLASSCADLERGAPAAGGVIDGGGGEGGMPGDGGSNASFAQDVHPLLLDGCGDCHAPGGQAGDTALVFTGDAAADRTAALAFVNTDTPAQSRLLGKAAGTGHEGGAVYPAGSAEYQTILGWIMQGTSP